MTFPLKRSLLGMGGAFVLALGAWFFLTERPVFVQVVTAERDVPVRVYGLGTVEARIVSKTGFEVGAVLDELLVDSNDAVKKGQILARLSTAEQEARVLRAEAGISAAGASMAKAQANVARAQAVLAQRDTANNRQQALASRSAVAATSAEEAQRDLDVAAADLQVARSEVDVIAAQAADADAALQYERTLLEHHVLKAPFDAVIVERHVEAGTVVQAGAIVFTLMDPKTVWIQAYIDEGRAGELAVGQASEIRLRSLPHQVFSGTIARIGIESDRVNEERRVWLSCTDCPAQVYLGEQAAVRITVSQVNEALMVPEIAVSGFDGHQGRVWVIQDGRLEQVELTFGHRTEDARVEVVSGMRDGAQIVRSVDKGFEAGRLARVSGDET